MKRKLSLLLAVVMILGSFSFAFADEPMTEADAGEFLKEKGVLVGINGELKLEDNLRREDAVVMVARLHGAEEEAEAFPTEGLTFKDVTDPYYQSIISWAVANELFEGHTPEKFGYHEDISAQQYATVLLRALGYGEEVADKAGYDKALELADELGLLEGLKVANTTPITRGQMALMTYNALGTKMKDSNETLADKLEIEMPAPEVLEVEDVFADNLKEVKVVFNKDVDENVLNPDFYETNAGEIEDLFIENGNVLVLVLKGKMNNKVDRTLTVKGISEEVDKTYTFKAYDNTIPEVVAVEALGTKTIKVTMSEPVLKETKVTSFRLDDKTIYGKINVSGRNVYITPYSRLAVGEHTLTVLPLEDYVGFKSLEKKLPFQVVEDNVKPTVVDHSATLERVTLVFDKDIDPDIAGKVYWKLGSSTKSGKATVLGNKVIVDFTDNPLPVYETTLYVEGFTDYSGNKMEDAKIDVKATIDEQRPVALKAEFGENYDEIIVKFNKTIDKDTFSRKNVVLKDSKGNVISAKDVESIDTRTFKIKLYNKLEVGVYDLTVFGVKDKTLLGNTMEEFNTKLEVVDTELPKVDNISGDGRTIHVTFTKEMDPATLDNANNYIFTVGGNKKVLSNVQFDIPSGNKSVIIILPEGYTVGGTGEKSVTHVAVTGAKTLDGRPLSNLGEHKEISVGYVKVNSVKAVGNRKIEVEFSQAVKKADTGNFSVTGTTVTNVEGHMTNKLTLTTTSDLKANATNLVTIKKDIEFVSGNKLEKDYTLGMEDKIKPSVEKMTVNATDESILELKFNEKLIADGTNFAHDLEIVRVRDNKKLTPITDYTTTVLEDTITIKLNTKAEESYYTVKVIKDAKYIKDAKGNVANESDVFETDRRIEVGKEEPTQPGDTTIPKNPAKDKLRESSTKIDGVTFSYEDGIVVFDTTNIDLENLNQTPNEDLGGKPEFAYVGIFVERPSDDVTHVEVTVDGNTKIVQLGEHAATTSDGRYYYFAVAEKDDEGNYVKIEEPTSWERTVRWYKKPGDKEVLVGEQSFTVIRKTK